MVILVALYKKIGIPSSIAIVQLFHEGKLLRNNATLQSLPNEHGFALHKAGFQDALALHYSWPPLCTPTLCTCGVPFFCASCALLSERGFTFSQS